jgi:putative ABC transport system ATP-binding protein
LLDTFSIKDNIFLPLVLSKTDYKEMERRLEPIAKSLGIEELLEKFPYEVSGGQKQRAAVARAIITSPKLLLADEPTGALDTKASNNLLNIFNQINEGGQTILMVTHSSQAASHAKRILFIRDGEVFNQIYRGDETRNEFFQKIISNLSVLSDGGVDIG